MLNVRREAMQSIANHLFEFERNLDLALASGAHLLAAMPQARLNARISALVGQPAVESVASSITFLTQARERLIATHGHLDDAKTAMGLRTVAVGGGYPKPQETGYLAAVETEAA